MMRSRSRPWWAAGAIAILCIVALVLWQWRTLARLAVGAVAQSAAQVHVSFRRLDLGRGQADFRDVRVTSLRDEPIAQIPRLLVAYDLHDLLFGGTHLFGLKAIDAESPRVTIIRRPDGTYNVPVPRVQPTAANGKSSLIVRAKVSDGTIDVIDERPHAAAPHLYVADLDVDADVGATRTQYVARMRYGQRPERLYPIRGRGDLNPSEGYVDQRWTAHRVPIAAAVNFVANSSSLRFLDGTLHDADVRYVGLRDTSGAIVAHLVGGATLFGGRVALEGLSKPIEDIRGPVDVNDDGLLTSGFAAELAGAGVRVDGGIYGLRAPRLRLAIRGSGDAERLRSAFAQAQRLLVRGPLSMTLLVEGATATPVTWIAVRSPRVTYAAAIVDRVSGLVAFDGREADVVAADAAYGSVALDARGRVRLARGSGSIAMLVGAHAPAGGVPYLGTVLQDVPLNVAAVATATDPKAIALQGALWGTGGSQHIDALFNVDDRGRGSVGPLHVSDGARTLYGRVALDRPARVTLGILAARRFAFPAARATIDGTAIGAQTAAGIGAGIAGRVTAAWGDVDARGNVAVSNGALRGAIFGDAGREGSFGATLGGTLQSPQIAGTVVVAGGHYRDFEVNGNAALAYAHGGLRLHDTALTVGPLFVGLAGTVDGLPAYGGFAPRYDIAAGIHSSDVRTLLATVQPRAAALVDGSIDAAMRVRGTPSSPWFGGTFFATEGSVNGLAFRDLRGALHGDTRDVTVDDGRVVVGATDVAFRGRRAGERANISVDAPQADLNDFNDLFDTGDTFAGTGRLALQATLIGTRVVATSGDTRVAGARYRRLELGTVAAHWRTSRDAVITALTLGGPTGRLELEGSVMPSTRAVNFRTDARDVDLGSWLPMLGFTAPVTGRLDATATVAGRYPDVAMQLHAAVFGGTAGRLEIQRFEVTAAAAHGRGSLSSAIIDVPSLETTASGTFGVRPGDPIALTLHSRSPDLDAFLLHATGKDFKLGGTLDSTLRVEGTRAAPQLRDAVTLSSLHYGNFTVPRVFADIDANRRAVSVENGEVDFPAGRALVSATVPIDATGAQIRIGGAPISAALRAEGLALSNFAALLPNGTAIGGRIDGDVTAHGTLNAPQLGGALALRGGTFSGPMERTPITDVVGDLSFAGTEARLQSHATAGGGALSAQGNVAVRSLRRPAEAAFSARATAVNAGLDMPDYFQGRLDADVSVVRAPSSAPRVGGNVAISDARIPLNAFLGQKAGGQTSPGLPKVAFDALRISAGSNVRVQSRNVDIGAQGAVALGGTLAAPALTGSFRSTGGSVNFYRNFNLERGTVSFEPSSGVIPDVDAVATTFVSDPATAIRLHVTGRATNMNLALASEPVYSREQILGLLVGAQQFGAVRGVRSSSGQPFSAGSAAANVALGQLNTAFTRNLLEPLSGSLAGTLGFSDVQITSDIQTGVGISAVKAFGKNVSAIFAQTFGYPKTQSITLEAHPSVGTGLRLTAFTSSGPTVLGLSQPQPVGMDVMNLNPLTALTAVSGTNGIAFSFQRKFP